MIVASKHDTAQIVLLFARLRISQADVQVMPIPERHQMFDFCASHTTAAAFSASL